MLNLVPVRINKSNKTLECLSECDTECQDPRICFINIFSLILTTEKVKQKGTFVLLLAKSRVKMMKWVPQDHTMEKCLSQDGFIPLSLAPKLEMFNLFTLVHETFSLRQTHREFQGVPAAFSFVGIINTAIYPCTICPCNSHWNTLVCYHQ